MSKNQAATIKQPSKFAIWYNSNVGQRTVGAFYSVGASIVIIGALFKIMHWPMAGTILTLGMVTEAVLFFIGVFEKPHKNYHWENVYPSLLINNEGPVAAVTVNERIGISDTTLDQSDAKKLEEGIKQLAETAGQLGNISQAAANSEVFAKSLSNASEAVVSFTTKQQNLDEVSDNMIKSYKDISGALSNASEGAKQYASHTETLSKNVNAINSIYELELKQIQTQAEAISSQTNKFTSATSDIDKLFTLISNTAKDMEAYRHQTEKLAKQVSDLNNVYGNMLNAIRS